MSRTFDPKCFELAEHFLSDRDVSGLSPQEIEALKKSLAWAIQEAVEDWMETTLED